MNKKLLQKSDISNLITKCYKAEAINGIKFHESEEGGVDFCINKTINEILDHAHINIYGLYIDNRLVGYFGEEFYKNERFLTSYFIMPECRDDENKQDFWNIITNHFNHNFRTLLYPKNIRARKFLLKNGCKLMETIIAEDGQRHVFQYNKENN